MRNKSIYLSTFDLLGLLHQHGIMGVGPTVADKTPWVILLHILRQEKKDDGFITLSLNQFGIMGGEDGLKTLSLNPKKVLAHDIWNREK